MPVTAARIVTVLAVVATLIFACALPPITQDPLYHSFADQRTIGGIPNFWNVANVPFFLVALWGCGALRFPRSFVENWERISYYIALVGIGMVGAGSIFYHLHPNDSRLTWDRLPMTIVFTSLLATTIGERVSRRLGKSLLVPLLGLGVASVLNWRVTGDLRLYATVQFGSMLLVTVILALCRPCYAGSGWLWGTVLLYGLAKYAEYFDRQLATIVAMGGHPWKHVTAAAAVFLYVHAVRIRQPVRKNFDCGPVVNWRIVRVLSPALLFFCCVPAQSQSKSLPALKDFFADPPSLCAALEEDGIHPGPWKQIGLGFFSTESAAPSNSPYVCEYPQWAPRSISPDPLPHPAAPDKDNMPDKKVLYRVSGDSDKRADIITIAVTVYQPVAMRAAEQELEGHVVALFKAINRRQPIGLVQSIDRHRDYRSRQPYGLVTFHLGIPDRRPNEQVLWFRLLGL